MNELQAMQIRQLRIKGTGYRAIATAVGLTRDIVRNYCKSHGLDGYANALKLNMKEQMHSGAACRFCGKEISQPETGRRRKFCSDKCRRDWWKLHPDQSQRKPSAYYQAVCICCGKDFLSYGNKDRKYCSHACYINARFGKKSEEQT